MPILLLKDLPRYECLIEAARKFPTLNPSATATFLNLLRTGDVMARGCEDYFQRHHLSQGRFTVLMLLMDKQTGCSCSRTPAELAQMAGVTRATMTGLIDTLERDGFVVRRQSESDRRMTTVSLTPKAISSLEEFLPGHFQRMAELMQPLSEDERGQLNGLLAKIVGHSLDYDANQQDFPAPLPAAG